MTRKLALALIVAGLTGAATAQAATVEIRTFNRIGPNITDEADSFPSGTPGGTLSNTVVAQDTGDTSSATAAFDSNGRRLSASAGLFRPTSSAFVNYRAAGFAKATEQITVVSGGTLVVALNFSGSFRSLTDLPETDGFASVSAYLNIDGPGLPIERERRRASSSDQSAAAFTDRIFAEFAVDAGDVFDITAQLVAVNGSTGDITSFIETSSGVEGVWSIIGRDGAIIDEDPLDPAPVPLPGSFPLLVGALLGAGTLQRRATRRAGRECSGS